MFPVLLGFGLGLGVGLSACSPSKKKKKKPSTFDPTKNSSSYRKKCIQDLACQDNERLRAAFDYTAAVYSENQNFKYDNFINASELKFILENFPDIKHPGQIKSLLRRAQNKYLKPFIIPNVEYQCNNASFYEVVHASDPMLGMALAIGGSHYCGYAYGEIFRNLNFEQKIAASPEDWIFFVESTGSMPDIVKNGGKPNAEYALFRQIARKLSIPFNDDYIKSITDEEVVTEAKRLGIDKVDLTLFSSITDELLSFKRAIESFEKNYSVSEYEELALKYLNDVFFFQTHKSPSTEAYISLNNINRETFFQRAREFFNVPKENSQERLGEKLAAAFKIFEKIGDLSNEISLKRIQKSLDESGKKHAFFQMGGGHLPIIRELYQNIQILPAGPKK